MSKRFEVDYNKEQDRYEIITYVGNKYSATYITHTMWNNPRDMCYILKGILEKLNNVEETNPSSALEQKPT
jgi:hypothetical protein